MTQKLIERPKKLEAATAALISGPCLWPARVEEVRKRTMEAMSPEEQALLAESFDGPHTVRFDEFSVMHPAVWVKYNEAFDRAVREVPAPFAMCTADLWGCW
jgi:hypothetical protein